MTKWLDYLAGWSRTENGVPVEQYDTADLAIHFIGEQDGPAERELKDRLARAFEVQRSVKRAYLAKVRYGNESDVTVALCLRCEPALDDAVVSAAGDVFHGMFNASQHLDIIPVTSEREAELIAACKPFYMRNGRHLASPER